ncbi:MAG: glycoside hydrolase family 3 protein [Bacteroidales bacterium]|nr:glycoside hydrolase family 3 protein [Bacteroidales bacterium]
MKKKLLLWSATLCIATVCLTMTMRVQEPIATIEPIEIDPIETFVEEQLARMSVDEKIGQLIIAKIPGKQTVNAATRALINDYHIGGFILFAENISSIEQVKRLTADLQALIEAVHPPLFISIDDEGGRVARTRNLFRPRIGTAYSIGQTRDTQNAYNAAHTIGTRLHGLGVNLNFAPVADIWSNPANTVIGDRAYGREPRITGEMVAAAVRGFREAGVLAVVKHFPGHGDTKQDSHDERAIHQHDKTRFDTLEAYPFQRGIAAGADGVMMGHISTPKVHPEEPTLPAVFSPYWIQEVLRNDWGYEGLVITDALDMGGVTRYYSGNEIVLKAFLAGVDILLMPANAGNAVQALRDAYHDGRITDERLDASVRRILRAKYRVSE